MTFYANQEMLRTIEYERSRETATRRMAKEARKSALRRRGLGRFELWRATGLLPVRRTRPSRVADQAVR